MPSGNKLQQLYKASIDIYIQQLMNGNLANLDTESLLGITTFSKLKPAEVTYNVIY